MQCGHTTETLQSAIARIYLCTFSGESSCNIQQEDDEERWG